MPGEPGENLLWSVGCDQNFGRAGKRDPLADVRSQCVSLSAAPKVVRFPSQGLRRAMRARGDKPKAHEDPPRLVGREVRSIEARCARKHLLGRETTAVDDHVVLLHRIGQMITEALLDLVVFEFEGLS